MRYGIASVKNVLAASEAFATLQDRSVGIPGMMTVSGDPGTGKTTTLAWMLARSNGRLIRVNSAWTVSALLAALMRELKADPMGTNAKNLHHIMTELGAAPKPLFVDEANYLVHDKKMLETLRDIHDVTGVPVVLAGSDQFERRMVHHPQLRRRLTQWVEFRPCDLEDAHVLVKKVMDIEVEEDLLDELVRATRGNIGLMTVGLEKIEKLALANGLAKVDSRQWGTREFFLAPATKARS